MLYLAGGRKMLRDPQSIIIALITGTTAGVSAIISNFFGIVTLTGINSGIAVIIVLGIYAYTQNFPIISRDHLTEEDMEIEKSISLLKALNPWILLIIFTMATNLIPSVFNLLFYDLTFPLTIGSFTIKTRILWQAYTWVLFAVAFSFIFLPSDRQTLNRSLHLFKKRAIRPMVSSAIFFAIAWILNNSSPNESSMNMVVILSDFTSTNLGLLFPLLVPFIGFFGGFVSGSETSSIVLFTRYHVQTSNTLGLDPMTIATANGVGGGLASVITPAKVQNAAATIDQIGIEGQVIRKTIMIGLAMISLLSLMTYIWASMFPRITPNLVGIIFILYIGLSTFLFISGALYSRKKTKQSKSGEK
jgi:lactate permease